MEPAQSCTVCSSERPKYRCPICRLMYCCSSCCQAHKLACVAPEAAKSGQPAEKREQRVLWDESSDQVVSAQALSWLSESRRLRQLLNNPHLRELVQQADTTPHPDDDLRRLMVEPLFVEFADECLRVVEGRPEPMEESD
ncbi:zinc finger HIT domain-containing protein 3-like isoform X2 [Amphibalanus amphitrite]|nr:zinc finger HIT domain-containing protein 3-like [Amphibalanus amphitrite]XP_043221543.1 zinc finger HIT domain-containing protein 3-like [Amphibalanus amphitrite]XP_043221544.1 zinc finger HIT domain-containing protein 3-like [Amphibalanus amphitrite]XP_043247706.1 zinc finger HIT domain-containing protein 3-like isoform X2 [Amphibalanus amphitrite]XP_043247707.1 zinc finger HIT domain-containing protein 3-like isoform X2 [Amphibalanus amphitrite]XP_043247708.1 zinc finger HIT domain-conta